MRRLMRCGYTQNTVSQQILGSTCRNEIGKGTKKTYYPAAMLFICRSHLHPARETGQKTVIHLEKPSQHRSPIQTSLLVMHTDRYSWFNSTRCKKQTNRLKVTSLRRYPDRTDLYLCMSYSYITYTWAKDNPDLNAIEKA